MTDTTHEAPERIWAEPDGGGLLVHNSAPNLDTLIATGYLTEYVRADLVQAAVAAALREAVNEINCGCTIENGGCKYPHACPQEDVKAILALIPDGGAALDRVLAAERERIAKMIEGKAPFTPEEIAQTSDIDRFAERRTISGSRAYHALAAAIRKGGE